MALLSHKDLPRPRVEVGIGAGEFDDEGRTLVAEYPEFILINGYFPNGQRDHGRVPFKLDYSRGVLDRALELMRGRGKGVVICGDLNTAHREVDLANPRQNRNTTGFLPEEREWIDRLCGRGFHDAFRELHGPRGGEYTWWTYRNNCRERNIGWRLDYFFVSQGLLGALADCSHRPRVQGSDHCPVYCDLDFA